MAQSACSYALSYGPDPRQRGDVLIPVSGHSGPLLVLIHGGWWREGKRHELLTTAFELVEQGHAVALLGYRLLQGSRRGADLIEDLALALPALMDEAQVLGFAGPRKVVLVGSGAGGLLAQSSLSVIEQTTYEHPMSVSGVAMVGTAPGFKPWESCPSEVASALGQFVPQQTEGPADLIDMSQVQSIPPTLLIHGDNDPEVPVRYAQELHGHLISQDAQSTIAIIAGAGHRFLEDPASRAGKSALSRLQGWLEKLDEAPHEDGVLQGEPRWLGR